MNVTQAHIPIPHPNRPGKKLEALKAIVIHYTQNDRPGATDTMNVQYIGRKYVKKEGKSFESDGVTPFRFGSAHIFCDMDSVTEAIPTDEVAWGCGDRNYKGGYQRIAEKVFKRRQNYETISVEICNNDVIKDSPQDWEAAVGNALQWVVTFLKTYNLKIDKVGSLFPRGVDEAPEAGTVLLLRHYDITGKICPKPFIDNPSAWKYFVEAVAEQVNHEGA